MSKILTLESNTYWSATNNNNVTYPVYKVQGISSNNSTTATANFNIWAAGISSIDGVDRLYRISGSNRKYEVKDISGNSYDNPVPAKEKIVLSINNRHCVLAPPKQPLPPVELPPCTFRMQFSNTAYNPTNVTGWKSGSTWTKVETEDGSNQWDYTHVTANWDDEFNGKFSAANNDVDILYAGDFSTVTSMSNKKYINNKVAGGTFGSSGSNKQSYLRSICTFDTSNIKNMDGMFFHCVNLTTLPPLVTSACSSFWSMFDTCGALKWINGMDFTNGIYLRSLAANCSLRILPDLSTLPSANMLHPSANVNYMFQGNIYAGEFGSPGILAAYSHISACNSHTSTFKGTGSATPAGSAELAQIPNNWKGQ